MPPDVDWQVTPAFQPNPKDYAFDLDAALAAVVTLKSTVPADAFTAGILGTERSGYGVLIERSGLVLTIGYLITEAETIWLGLSDGRTVPGHALGYDQTTGFGLVQALARLDAPALAARPFACARNGRAGDCRRRRRASARNRGDRRRQAGIRGLLGVSARRGDLHRAGPPVLGRSGADRAGAATSAASPRSASISRRTRGAAASSST